MSFSQDTINNNLNAFLDLLAWCEGTTAVTGSDDGYNVLFGGKLFTGYNDHPRKLTPFTNKKGKRLASTAAGRYQEKAHNYDVYKQELKLTDFSPKSQDLIALKQIDECKATAIILKGNITDAINACAHIWASLPGAGYSQPEKTMTQCLAQYKTFGGTFAV